MKKNIKFIIALNLCVSMLAHMSQAYADLSIERSARTHMQDTHTLAGKIFSQSLSDLQNYSDSKVQMIVNDMVSHAQNRPHLFPLPKVSAGLQLENQFMWATNGIGVDRHAEINLIFNVFDFYIKKADSVLEEHEINLVYSLYKRSSLYLLDQKQMTDLHRIAVKLGRGASIFAGKTVYVLLKPTLHHVNILRKLGVADIFYLYETSNKLKRSYVTQKTITVSQIDERFRPKKQPEALFREFNLLSKNRLAFAQMKYQMTEMYNESYEKESLLEKLDVFFLKHFRDSQNDLSNVYEEFCDAFDIEFAPIPRTANELYDFLNNTLIIKTELLHIHKRVNVQPI